MARLGDLGQGLLARPALLPREGDEQAAVRGHERITGLEHLHLLGAGGEVLQRKVDTDGADALAAALDRRHVAGHHRAGVQVGLEHPVEALLDRQRVVAVLRPRLVRLVLERREVELAGQPLGPEGEPTVLVAQQAAADVARVATERVRLERDPRAEQVGIAHGEALGHRDAAGAIARLVGLHRAREAVRQRLRAARLGVEARGLGRDQLGHLAVDGVALGGRRDLDGDRGKGDHGERDAGQDQEKKAGAQRAHARGREGVHTSY